MPFLALKDSHIRYEVQGDGHAILMFAPGFLSSRIERWSTNPARPGVPQDFLDPIPTLSKQFHVVALDIRNAGQSRGKVDATTDWDSYTADHLALLDHLGVKTCHVMGACIGVTFALALAAARPGLVTALVLQNPIGLSTRNRAALDKEFAAWVEQVKNFPGVDAAALPGFYQRMFAGDFLFAVKPGYVAACDIPMLLMPGDDLIHPEEISADILRLAPKAEQVAPWKGNDHKARALELTAAFLARHTPGKP